jgi:alpha-L-glutamate ligase-like protein
MMFGLAHRLWRNGVVGLNKRNADYLLAYNERRYYPMADDKLLAKEMAQGSGINVPALYGKFEYPHEVENYREVTDNHTEFVVKPACGSGGDGILVVLGKSEGYFSLADGSAMDEDDMAFHLHAILAGAFSLAGQPDKALIEYRVNFDPVFEKVTYKGVPDIRIIVFCGVPVMAMLRLPTMMSAGKANLHQGALGAGISIPSGRTLTAVWRNIVIERHPDTKNPITNLEIPHWDELLVLAARCCDLTKLRFLGIDIVLDRDRGPLMLELNARPGLNIQIANREGLLKRLELIEANIEALETASDRVAFAIQYFDPNPIA